MQDCVIEVDCGRGIDLTHGENGLTLKVKAQIRYVGRENLPQGGGVRMIGSEHLVSLQARY